MLKLCCSLRSMNLITTVTNLNNIYNRCKWIQTMHMSVNDSSKRTLDLVNVQCVLFTVGRECDSLKVWPDIVWVVLPFLGDPYWF